MDLLLAYHTELCFDQMQWLLIYVSKTKKSFYQTNACGQLQLMSINLSYSYCIFTINFTRCKLCCPILPSSIMQRITNFWFLKKWQKPYLWHFIPLYRLYQRQIEKMSRESCRSSPSQYSMIHRHSYLKNGKILG